MKAFDFILALSVTVIWGLNFAVIKLGMAAMDPYLLAAIRFALCAFPAIFFISKPKVKIQYLAGYGIMLGVFLWGLAYAGIYLGLSAGLASLVLQCTVFFTIIFGAIFFNEKISKYQIIGAIISFCGLGSIFLITDGSTTFLGILLVILGALSWSIANIFLKKSATTEMLAFMIWSSIFSPIPLLLISYFMTGSDKMISSIMNIDKKSIFSILFTVYPVTLLGYSIWNHLLRKYPLSTIAPLSLFVPIFGMLGSMIIFDEKLTQFKLIAMLLIIVGLLINIFGRMVWNWISRILFRF
jgi:O-acetylserine/cysteine efflux transporter